LMICSIVYPWLSNLSMKRYSACVVVCMFCILASGICNGLLLYSTGYNFLNISAVLLICIFESCHLNVLRIFALVYCLIFSILFMNLIFFLISSNNSFSVLRILIHLSFFLCFIFLDLSATVFSVAYCIRNSVLDIGSICFLAFPFGIRCNANVLVIL